MNRQKVSMTIIVTSVLLILVMNIAILTSIKKDWRIDFHLDVSSRTHISHMIQELNIGRLELEKSINMRDKKSMGSEALSHFINASDANKAFLAYVQGIEYNEKDTAIFDEFKKMQFSLLALIQKAEVELSSIAGQDSVSKEFDSVYEKNIVHLHSVDSQLEEHFNTQFMSTDRAFNRSSFYLIGANGLMFLVVFLVYRSRKKYENFITQQKKVFEVLFQKSADGILLIENFRIIDCNEAVLSMLRANSKDEVINKHLVELSPLIQEDGRDSFVKIEEMLKICLQRGTHSYEWIHQRFDGEVFWVEVVLTDLNLNNKQVIHVAWRDISKRKALELSLQQKSKLYKTLSLELDKTVKQQSAYLLQQSRLAQMGEMVSMIAHQWRQPLAAISAISGTLSLGIILDKFDKKSYLERLESLSEMSQHLSSTIDVFRSFFQEDKSKEVVSIHSIVQSCIDIIGPMLKSKQVLLHCNIDESYKAQLPPNELKQVVLNLFKNAEDVLLEREIQTPQIWVDVYEEEDWLYVTIEDNAGGISEDVLENIFDPYFTTKSSNGGTGLGLYMSKIIVEEHCCGYFDVENTPAGAKFKISIPSASITQTSDIKPKEIAC